MKLKILLVTPIYGGSLPTAGFAYQALKNLGHHVEVFRSNDFKDSFRNIAFITPNEQDTAILRESFTNLLGEAILSKAKNFKPDILIALAQAPLNTSVLKRLKALKIITAFWFVEDFRILTYWDTVAPYYDCFFTIQKEAFFKKLRKIGVNNYFYLPQACSPAVHKKITLSPEEKKEYGSDLSFVGAGYYNRQIFFRGLIDFDLKIWGTEWDKQTVLAKFLQREGARISSDECIKIFNASKININLHSSVYHEGVNPDGDFINPRTFEIASCGAFQLVDYRLCLPECFEIGKEIITFKDIHDLRQKISYYLDNDEEREEISRRSQEKAHSHHSFEIRFTEMLESIIATNIEKFNVLGCKENEIDRVIREAGSETELGQYFMRFKGKEELTLEEIIQDIERGEGDLTFPESIFVMMNQFLTEKK